MSCELKSGCGVVGGFLKTEFASLGRRGGSPGQRAELSGGRPGITFPISHKREFLKQDELLAQSHVASSVSIIAESKIVHSSLFFV